MSTYLRHIEIRRNCRVESSEWITNAIEIPCPPFLFSQFVGWVEQPPKKIENPDLMWNFHFT